MHEEEVEFLSSLHSNLNVSGHHVCAFGLLNV